MRFYNQIDGVSSESTAIDVINSSVSPVPTTPATLSAMSTMSSRGPVQIRNMTILNRETVNSIISQQSATNATLSKAQQLAQGIVPGIAGATLQQLTRPGLQIKPGSAEFIQQKMNMGMKFEKAMSPALITGNLGVRTVNDVVRNTNAQITAVATGLKDSANNLINKGIISGLEPATQIGGIIAAAGAFGNQTIGAILKDPKNVVNILSTRGTELVGKLSSGITSGITNLTSTITGGLDKLKSVGNMISSGNFASGIADKFSSGLSGVAAGLSGAVAGAVGKFVGGLFGKSANVSIGQLVNQLKSTAQQAFARAESSFGTLKPGVPNYLGQNSVTTSEETETQKSVQKLNIAELELQQASDLLLQARIDSDTIGDSASQAKLAEADRKYAQAKQKLAQTTSEIISPSPKKKGGIFGGLKGAIDSATSTLKGGISSIPGGIGAFANEVIGKGTNVFTTAYKTAITVTTAYATGGLSLLQNTKIGESFAKLTNPEKLAGSLLENTKSALNNIGNSVQGKASREIAKLGGTLGSIGGSSGMIKTPTFAQDTDKLKSTLTAKTGQLIENEIYPLPPSISGDVVVERSPNDQIIAQRSAIQQINVIEAEVIKQNLIVEKLYAESIASPEDAGKLKKVNDARSKMLALEKQLAQAQNVYDAIVRTG